MNRLIGIDFGTKQLTSMVFKDGKFVYKEILDPEQHIPQEYQKMCNKYSKVMQIPGYQIHAGTDSLSKFVIGSTAKLLHKAKKFMERVFEDNLDTAVIAVPAFYDDTMRHIVLKAAELVGLKAQIINNCTALARAVFFRFRLPNGFYFVSDSGAGKFECSLFQKTADKITVLSTYSNDNLGLQDRDSSNSHDQYYENIWGLIAETLQILDGDYNKVICAFVNGTGATDPKIKEIFTSTFQFVHYFDKKNHVALGAISHVKDLEKNQKTLTVEDVVCSGLGIRCHNGGVETIIPQFFKQGEIKILKVINIPAFRRKIHIYDINSRNYLWGFEFEIDPQDEYYLLIFQVNQNGILEASVAIKDIITKFKRTIISNQEFEVLVKKFQKYKSSKSFKEIMEAKQDLIEDCNKIKNILKKPLLRNKFVEAKFEFRSICDNILKWIENEKVENLDIGSIEEVSKRLLDNFSEFNRLLFEDDAD